MKFHMGTNNELIAERKDLQPAFFKGALAAHEGREENNPYQRKSFREAWDTGYHGVKQGKVIVEEEPIQRFEKPNKGILKKCHKILD